jgi:non-ribosomal peptide synthetase component F
VKALALAEGTTVFSVLLACYHVLLAKLCHQEDLVIGLPHSGRAAPELEGVLGMFINTLALRNQSPAGQSFRTFLGQVKHNVVGALEHADYPYHALVDKLKVVRKPGRNPLFDTAFLYQNYRFVRVALPGLTLREYDQALSGAKFDLKLQGYEQQDVIAFRFEYKKSLFLAATIDRFIEYFLDVFRVVLQDPDVLIGAINPGAEEAVDALFDDFDTLENES